MNQDGDHCGQPCRLPTPAALHCVLCMRNQRRPQTQEHTSDNMMRQTPSNTFAMTLCPHTITTQAAPSPSTTTSSTCTDGPAVPVPACPAAGCGLAGGTCPAPFRLVLAAAVLWATSPESLPRLALQASMPQMLQVQSQSKAGSQCSPSGSEHSGISCHCKRSMCTARLQGSLTTRIHDQLHACAPQHMVCNALKQAHDTNLKLQC